jgi:hypothetical protein
LPFGSDRTAQLVVACKSRQRLGERAGVFGRHEQCGLAVLEQLACGRRVRGDHGRSRDKRFEHCRWNGARLAEAAQHDPRVRECDPAISGRNLAGLDDPQRQVGRKPSRGLDDVVRGIGDVERGERIRRRPGLAEDVLVGAEEDRGGPSCAELLEVRRLGACPADDEVRQTQRATVHRAQNGRCGRARTKAAAHLDELVFERQHRVEDERALARDATRTRHVEVPWVPDNHHVECSAPRTSEGRNAESRLRA